MCNTLIESLGVYLPPQAVSTQEVLQGCKKKVRFPLERITGIKSRRVAGETEFSIDLAGKAIADCLARSKYHPKDIDVLICSTICRYDGPNFQISYEPCTAVKLKKNFGLENALAFDLASACSGMFAAINLVDAFIKAGTIRRGLVVSGEYISHLAQTAQKEIAQFLDPRLACLTVGDAGAAVILEKRQTITWAFTKSTCSRSAVTAPIASPNRRMRRMAAPSCSPRRSR
jgi:3-oxoacyl-[acyl-carrier-protein] synthase III